MRVRVWLLLLLLGLFTPPAWRVATHLQSDSLPQSWWRMSWLYNRDSVTALAQRLLYAAGVSLEPDQVVVGHGGWLQVGNRYDRAIDRRMERTDASTEQRARIIAASMVAWRQWFRQRGVQSFHVLIGADKGSVYPDSLPRWALGPDGSANEPVTETLTRVSDPSVLLDSREALRSAVPRDGDLLFYRTDSHWTQLAAWHAVRLWARAVATDIGLELRTPERDDFELQVQRPAPPGDLSRFLRMSDQLEDFELLLEHHDTGAAPVTQVDLETGESAPLDDQPRASVPHRSTLLKTSTATNPQRLLFLHDSFGSAMLRSLAPMFPVILHQHYQDVTPEAIARLVADFKPDLVLIAIVERAMSSDWLMQPPPDRPGPDRPGPDRG